MTRFELDGTREAEQTPGPRASHSMRSPVLLHNAKWFIRIRWHVTGVFVAMGLAAMLAPNSLRAMGIIVTGNWPLVLAGILAIANVALRLSLRGLTQSSAASRVVGNTWMQIVFDLVAVTFVVHKLGSVTTFIPFIYLFHIVLSCIFFSQSRSLVVTALAGTLYLGCVSLELVGLLPQHCLLADIAITAGRGVAAPWMHAFSAVMIWIIVWYLVSTLSESLRHRDHDLEQANERLTKASEEKNQMVLRTTHDLKAPFSGMESNIELLRSEHWDKMPPDVREIISNIQVRAKTLSGRISDILLLGSLRSVGRAKIEHSDLNVRVLIEGIVEEIKPRITERRIDVHVEAPEILARTDARQFRILLANIVANAVFYSHEGGRVDIIASHTAEGVSISVQDSGIGIDAEALPHIFEEYYRTAEASRFNRMSTGLGLAIVREVAMNLKLKIVVNSEAGRGTRFEVTVPAR